jgi:anti-sigma-K factor RskA
MIELDDMDALAAEYVLGTLTDAERTSVAARRQREPDLDRAIASWERRLGPMIATVPAVAPGAHVFERIRKDIAGAAGARGPGDNVIAFTLREAALERRSRSWRSAALAMGALAASLAGALVWREAPPPAGATYVAMLQADKSAPAMLLTVDTEKQSFALRALSKPEQPDKTYELWLIHDSLPGPKSLGVVPEDDMEIRPLGTSGVDRSMLSNATFAISLEPQGGSPTGAPTGPVLFTGKLYKTTR